MLRILDTQDEDRTDTLAVVRGTGVYRIGREETGTLSSA
jgi:hypothetical protein